MRAALIFASEGIPFVPDRIFGSDLQEVFPRFLFQNGNNERRPASSGWLAAQVGVGLGGYVLCFGFSACTGLFGLVSFRPTVRHGAVSIVIA